MVWRIQGRTWNFESQNNIDVIGTNSDLANGMKCGYILFNDGHVENMVYKDTGKNDVEYIKRQLQNR